jgi:hypothetical protein
VIDAAQSRDVSESTVPVVNEAEFAEHLGRTGQRVVQHEGRYWHQTSPGFYRPVHPLARLSAREATRPTLACWGFQACLTRADEHLANPQVPFYLVSDLDSFDETRMTQDRRRRLRRARRLAQMVELTGPAMLREQGYAVLQSARERTGYGALPTVLRYQASLDRIGQRAEGIVLAAVVDGRLGGYATGCAVGATACARALVVATWALKTHISAGLTYEFIYACRRTGGIREMVHGLHARENEGLCRNKELVGLPLQRVPARTVMPPGVGALMRRRNPHKYYRLTGRG